MLIVGDPHIKPDNIPESEKLLQFVKTKALENSVKTVVFLGDLFHTHRLIRMEVERFWIKWATQIGEIAKVILIVGNHDQPGDDQNEQVMSALDVLKEIKNVTVVDKPMEVDGISYFPHTSSDSKFKEWAEKTKTDLLFCHQSFDGSQYENGFYAKDSLPLDSISKFKKVICGHIHKSQELGNLWFPGTPKWDSLSDANENKGIWLFDTSSLNKIFFSTEIVCSKIVSIELKENDDIPSILDNSRTYIKLIGSSSWIAKTAKVLKGKAKISSKPTDTKFSGDSKSLSSIRSYADSYKFDGVLKEEVLEYLDTV
jgi:DNA repair exonuclease SbcCD nuclease subunit